jgi:prophage regulatory protein
MPSKARRSIQILRLPTVVSRTGLRKTSIYTLVSEGRFPKPVKLGCRAVGWPEHAVDDWLREQGAA